MSDQGFLLGRIAVQAKLITMDQLNETTTQQAREPGKSIGRILIERGLINERQLEKLIKIQKDYIAKRKSQQVAAAQAVAAAPAAPAATEQPAAASAAAPTATVRLDRATILQAAGAQAAPPVSAPPAPAATAVAEPPTQERPPAVTGGVTAPAPEPRPSPAAAGVTSGRLDAILTQGVQMGASDIHVHSGSPLSMRINGKLGPQGETPIAAEEAEAMLIEVLAPDQKVIWEKQGELDFSHTIPNVGRFRANIFRQHRGVDGVFRAIPAKPPSLQELGLPSMLARFTNFHQGIVLVTGPGGCGKSSTMASFVDIINEERKDHILTIEDPIEYLHPSKRCVVNQRQVFRHTESFARAQRAALREDPDVIANCELRDLETISLALTAAETGHLVLATLHTNNTIRTINRLVGVFPPNQQSQIRTMMSESLRAIVSQRLVVTTDGKRRVPAIEVLVINKAVSNLIRESKTFQIRSVLQTGSALGMCMLDGSLTDLVKAGTISKEEALRNCEDPRRFA